MNPSPTLLIIKNTFLIENRRDPSPELVTSIGCTCVCVCVCVCVCSRQHSGSESVDCNVVVCGQASSHLCVCGGRRVFF